MNQLKTVLTAAAMLFALHQHAFAGGSLSPSELKNLAPGRYQVVLMGISSMTVTLRSNGTVLGTAKGSSDTGHWNLSGAKFCIAWNNWLGGRARCSALVDEVGYYQGSGFTVRRI